MTTCHALWMLLMTFTINNSSLSHWDDQEIASFFTFLKKNVLNIDEAFNEDEFLFIDVSKSNELVPAFNDEGFEIGNEDITNRLTLGKVLTQLNRVNVHKMILCDILFESPSSSDSSFKPIIESTPRLLVSSYHKNDTLIAPLFNVKYSSSDYESQGSFFKSEVFIKGDQSTPQMILERDGEAKSEYILGGFYSYNDDFYFNKYVLDFRIRPYHYQQNRKVETLNIDAVKRINIVDIEPLSELCTMMGAMGDDSFFEEMFKDKIIVLGDFSDRDIHPTIVGDLAGPLILINSYLSLVNQDNRVNGFMLFFIFATFWFISFFIFKDGDLVEVFFKKVFSRSKLFLSVFELFTVFFLLLLFCFITYVIWGFQFAVILVVLYLKLIEWLWNYRKKSKEVSKA